MSGPLGPTGPWWALAECSLQWIPLDSLPNTATSGAIDVSECSHDYRLGYADALAAVADQIAQHGKGYINGWLTDQLKVWKP